VSESLKIASWNIRDGLSGGTEDTSQTMHDVVGRVLKMDADIVMLPEAFKARARTESGRPAEILALASERLLDEGYDVHRVLYGDADNRKDSHGFALLTRLGGEADEVSTVELGSRRTLQQYIANLSLTVTGVHLDDRRETTRLAQARALLEQSTDNQIILGDFNAMHGSVPLARKLRLVRAMGASMLPVDPPVNRTSLLGKMHYKATLANRLTGMADGTTMAMFEAAGYVDEDENRTPTKGPVQLDRIISNTGLKVDDYKVEEVNPDESDHHPISAVIRY